MAGAKANNSNSAVKAQLQMQNNNNNNSNSNNASQQPSSNKNAVAPVNNAVSNHTSAQAMDTAGSLATTTTMKTNGTAPEGNENAATTTTGLKHDSGLATDWSPEEQSILDDALTKHAALTNPLIKYIKIAALLSEKTVRDVAFRIRYMTKKENGKRRKDEVQNGTKKSKDKKDKAETALKQMPATNIASRPHMPMYSPPPAIDNDDGISNDAIGGTAGQLLEQNTQFIAQIRSNLANMKLQENTDLLFRMRDNITTILNGMTNLPGILSHMPQLPVELNTELADSILPKSTLQFQS